MDEDARDELIAAPVDDVVDVWHGVDVADPYRWLEDGTADATRAWADAQNSRTRAALDAIPERDALHARLVELLRVGQSGAPAVGGDLVFALERWGAHDQAVLTVRGLDDANDGEPRVLVDPAHRTGDATAAIDWHHPSPDGRLVAYGTSTGGDERSTLRIVDVETGEQLADEIPETRACSLAWDADGQGFAYTVYPEGDEYHRHVRRHRLGTDPTTDDVVLGPDELPDETAWPSIVSSHDGRWLLVELSLGWSRVDLRLLDRSNGEWTTLLEGVEAVTSLSWDRERRRFVGVTTLDADRGRVVAVRPDDPAAPRWETTVPEPDDPRRVIGWAAPLLSGVLVGSTRWGVADVTWHDAAGDELERPFGDSTYDIVGVATHRDRDVAVLAHVTFTQPATLVRWQPGGDLDRWPLPGDPGTGGMEQVQTSYVSTDGTPVPIFLVRGATTPPRDAPAILTAYGGFAIAQAPAFSPLIVAWCERGGLYAIAGIRGGAEEGEAWHRAGMRANKQQVFDDFVAATDWLVAERHAPRERLAWRGGSNGGLLVAVAMTQRPDAVAAVHCAVPLTDMVRFPQFLIARLWTPEYGDPDVEDEFAWLWAYSPYHRVVDGTCYPATLVTTAEEDTRVDPAHARKFAARVQAATSCGDARPILVRIESRAGHGVGKPVGKQADEAADVLAFLTRELTGG